MMNLRVLPILVILAAAAPAKAEPFFPDATTDARSLGRGGTAIAAPGGASSVFGNPATLRSYGGFSLGVEQIRSEDEESSLAFNLVDSSSGIRGAAVYIPEPYFAGFDKNLWGVAFAQNLGAGLGIGESYHSGKFTADGSEQTLSGLDLGAVLALGPKLHFGFLARNVYRSDEDLLPRAQASGVMILLPWTMVLTVDYEQISDPEKYPGLPWENEYRAGLEFSLFSFLTARVGYSEPSTGTGLAFAGLTYRDQNGTLDLGVSYDQEEDRMRQMVLGLSLGM